MIVFLHRFFFLFFSIRSQKQTMINNKTEMYEAKLAKLKAYYLEEIRERDEKLKVNCLYSKYGIIY